jgi:N-acetylglucosaminyldiphosphoundecaprenol N-acetyl-beta-D-mannosaminyltransferase
MTRSLSSLQNEGSDSRRSLSADGTIVNAAIPVDRFKFELAESVPVDRVNLNPTTMIVKRAFDVVLSLVLVVASLPVLLVAALIVALVRGKEVFIYDERVGLNGKVFTHYVLNVYQRFNKPRSRALYFLKRCGLRLMPSLLNILKGDMSFVGPEPATVVHTKHYTSYESQRLAVRPGLTCFWFLRKHANLGFDEQTACDIGYLKKIGLFTDIGILLRSIIVVVMRGSKAVVEERIKILGVKFFNLTMNDALSYVTIAARRRSMWTLSFINADCLNISFRDPEYMKILMNADAVFPDGIGIHLASRLLRVGLKENTNGTDFFPRLCREAAKHNLKIYLLGGAEGVAEAAANSMRRIVPNVQIVGTHHGYLDEDSENKVIAEINSLKTDILMVGMGVPHQEKWIARTRARINAGVAMGVGGLFDFYSGKNARAPIWMREVGLEWVYRISQEPRRMWKRYVVGNPLFLYRVLRFGAEHPTKATETVTPKAKTQAVGNEA